MLAEPPFRSSKARHEDRLFQLTLPRASFAETLRRMDAL
jgi:hypothetical protein